MWCLDASEWFESEQWCEGFVGRALLFPEENFDVLIARINATWMGYDGDMPDPEG